MPSNKQNNGRFVLDKKIDGWFVGLPVSTEIGPFMNAAFALRVLATHLYMARKSGDDAHLFVRDSAGFAHRCWAIDAATDPACCSKCVDAWPTPTRAANCPLRVELASVASSPSVA